MTRRNAYQQSGVDIGAAEQGINEAKLAVLDTYTPEVSSEFGAFAGLYRLNLDSEEVTLAASTDGVGTKTVLAVQANQLEGLGFDLINHGVNDLLGQGALPLFALDYLASNKLNPQDITTILKSIANACRKVGIPLLGGETAEMPDVYNPGEIDLVGTVVGVVQPGINFDRERVEEGDLLLGLPSNGLHTNGYTLARKALTNNLQDPLGTQTVLGALLVPHQNYVNEVKPLLEQPSCIKGIAHITGGGIPDNLARILPPTMGAHINRDAWCPPEIFQLIQDQSEATTIDMFGTFNMGIGMIFVVSPEDRVEVTTRSSGSLIELGHVIAEPNITFSPQL
ncbi:MAG: phosphoribosylformylglycinamidine cyclo-ligase [Trueperaceae bacterium]|nr:phosphoribosylformylglycinamidine cyclo-ligase [Trueperaceae bacterium]